MSQRERSFIFRIDRISLAVEDFSVLSDRHVDTGAAVSIDQLDRLRHGVGIFSAVLHSLKANAGPIQVRVLRTLSGVSSANLWVSFISVRLANERLPVLT